jgi:signal transduction histidine kinase
MSWTGWSTRNEGGGPWGRNSDEILVMNMVGRGILRPLHLTLVTSVVAGATTLLVSGLALVDLAYRSPSLHVALETAVAVIAVVAAHLVHGRFRQRPTHSDLVLFYALSVFALTNLLFSAMPAAVSSSYPDGFATWAPTLGTLGGASLLVWAAFASNRHASSRVRQRVDRVGAAVMVAVTLVAVIILGAFGSAPEQTRFVPSRWGWNDVTSHPEVGLQALICVLFLVAGVGFARRAEVEGDKLMSWLAAGSIFGAFARLNYFIFPSLYSDWIYTGDILRVCFYLLLFIGAASEIRAYQRRAAESAVLEERRRIARDLHDGLAQELAYIAAQTQRLAATGEVPQPGLLAHLASAAERALEESRSAVAALAGPVDVAFHIALAREVEEIASRVGTRIELEVPEDLDIDPTTRETLLRIVREAVANAARHGRAGKIVVHLSNGAGLHLSIVDDGIGFDTDALTTESGFGLNSMRERAVAAGGDFHLTTQAGGGTRIEVVLP